ncbi:diguanylate cyclase [Caballeronia arationis]|jgi:diguanylate cyclase (GGDEF)-like protein|uniref:diguanylate cyclase n=1 Tax=Caballeronia arationis TaxID=1777142 RepID=A0A7Z7N4S0_9BURK|nr:sensor domain-containing diguanylate cyclase [Caballeronia arationis]SAK60364.1 diguanylate cyclase [Caballeronia arationis]SOE82271.1 diguanylate cyclase (GGDEF) domain-containing protein [Caballeronia arationis]
MNKTTLHRVTATLALALLACACWVAAGALSDRMVQQEMSATVRAERQMAASIVDNMAQIIASDLAMSRAIPATLAQMDLMQHALVESRHYASKPPATESERRADWMARPELVKVNNFLHDAQGFSGLDSVWLVNDQGVCVASSNATDDNSFIGFDMSGRGYVARALLGGFVEMYGVGRLSGEPGIFIAAPVYDDGFLVGALIAKVSIDRLRHWVSRAGTFVTDENGVVVMAHDGRLEYEALPDAPVTKMTVEERVDHYRREAFPQLHVARVGEQIRATEKWLPSAVANSFYSANGSSTPALYDERTGLNSGLSAHIVHPLTSWPDLTRNHSRDRILVFLTMLGIVALATVIATSYSRERRLHRATRDLAEQLQAANTLLSAEARHDALTGALSRRYFLDTLRHEVELARAAGTPLSVAIADLDYFKQINDRFGHASGDRALEHFVEVCRAQLRPSDAIGRLGGEEFGLLLPQTSLADAQAVLERLRKRFHHEHCAHLPEEAALSVSIGITELAEGDATEWILSRADLALYEAKSRGRDRSEVRPADSMPPARRPENSLTGK